MKIVVLDGYTLNPGDLSWNGLELIGDVKVYERTSEHEVLERINDVDIVFTNKTPISRAVFEKVRKVKYVGVLATGYDVVDIESAREKGIVVTNIPTYGTTAVAQMTFALLLEMCHHVWAHSEEVKKGAWSNCPDYCFWNYPLIELAGKTMGIIGYGKIGQMVGEIAQAFSMKVLAYDTYQNQELVTDSLKYVDLDTLLIKSDVISLHCLLSKDTQAIINEHSITKMKDGVMIINTSRGQLIVEEHLRAALDIGKVAGAAVDVVSIEPIKAGNPLLEAKNCIITPHISWAPKESRERLMNIAVDNLKKFIEGNPTNIVNR